MTRTVCDWCVMDDTAQEFAKFDDGCNFCIPAREMLNKSKDHLAQGLVFEHKIREIRESGKTSEFDAVIGVSGGVDSSYLLHLLSETELRVLPVHVNAGWDSAEACENIQRMMTKLNLKLFTYVVDWESMRGLQIAFLKSGVINQDIPQDHAFLAALRLVAQKHGIKNLISGGNLATESIGPKSWGHQAMDYRYLRSIHTRYGEGSIKQFPTWSIKKEIWSTQFTKSFKLINPLNSTDYVPSLATQILKEKYGYKTYGDKHTESSFTRFFQQIYLPERLGIDKRKSHLSSLIVSKEISRNAALELLHSPPISVIERRKLVGFVAAKLEMSQDNLEVLMKMKRTGERIPSENFINTTILNISKARSKVRKQHK